MMSQRFNHDNHNKRTLSTLQNIKPDACLSSQNMPQSLKRSKQQKKYKTIYNIDLFSYIGLQRQTATNGGVIRDQMSPSLNESPDYKYGKYLSKS